MLNPKSGGNPEKFFEGYKNDGLSPIFFMLGSVIHQLVLQRDLFELAPDLERPTAKLGYLADKLFSRIKTRSEIIKCANECDYYRNKMTSQTVDAVLERCSTYWQKRLEYESGIKTSKEIIYLDQRNLEIVTKCLEGVKANKKFDELLHPPMCESANEQAILLDMIAVFPDKTEIPLRLKAKLDNYTLDTVRNSITVNDLKTIGKPVWKANENIEKFFYRRELALYLYLLNLCAEKFYGMKDPSKSANYLFVSTMDYRTKVRPMYQDELIKGMNDVRILLRYAAALIKQGYTFR